jgi:hypothetical protein
MKAHSFSHRLWVAGVIKRECVSSCEAIKTSEYVVVWRRLILFSREDAAIFYATHKSITDGTAHSPIPSGGFSPQVLFCVVWRY